MTSKNKNNYVTSSEAYTLTKVPPKILNKWAENGYIEAIPALNNQRQKLFNICEVIKYSTSHPIKNRDVVWDRIEPQEDEEFKLLTGYDDRYAVSSKGRIVNFTSGEVLEPKPRTDGYICVYLQKNGVSKPQYTSNLVAKMFCPNRRLQMLPNAKWETHHIEIGFEHRQDTNPDKLLPVINEEHTELHKLWNNGKRKEYWKMVKKIQKANKEELFKIPHPDYSSDEHTNYFMWLTKKGYTDYQIGKEIPLDCIRCESVECVLNVEEIN